eukprot:Gb_25908 [translate_table: standard]
MLEVLQDSDDEGSTRYGLELLPDIPEVSLKGYRVLVVEQKLMNNLPRHQSDGGQTIQLPEVEGSSSNVDGKRKWPSTEFESGPVPPLRPVEIYGFETTRSQKAYQKGHPRLHEGPNPTRCQEMLWHLNMANVTCLLMEQRYMPADAPFQRDRTMRTHKYASLVMSHEEFEARKVEGHLEDTLLFATRLLLGFETLNIKHWACCRGAARNEKLSRLWDPPIVINGYHLQEDVGQPHICNLQVETVPLMAVLLQKGQLRASGVKWKDKERNDFDQRFSVTSNVIENGAAKSKHGMVAALEYCWPFEYRWYGASLEKSIKSGRAESEILTSNGGGSIEAHGNGRITLVTGKMEITGSF